MGYKDWRDYNADTGFSKEGSNAMLSDALKNQEDKTLSVQLHFQYIALWKSGKQEA